MKYMTMFIEIIPKYLKLKLISYITESSILNFERHIKYLFFAECDN